MEALSSGSASLDDFVAKVEATDWAGCDARAFARAVTVKLVTLSKSEKYKNDTDGKKKPGWRASTTKRSMQARGQLLVRSGSKWQSCWG